MSGPFKAVVARVRKLVHDVGTQYTRYFGSEAEMNAALKRYTIFDEFKRKGMFYGEGRKVEKYTPSKIADTPPERGEKVYNYIAYNRTTGRSRPGKKKDLERLDPKEWSVFPITHKF